MIFPNEVDVFEEELFLVRLERLCCCLKGIPVFFRNEANIDRVVVYVEEMMRAKFIFFIQGQEIFDLYICHTRGTVKSR